MKSPITVVGLLLVIAGILALSYQGYTYQKPEEIAKIGNVKITAEQDKTIQFPPYLGGAALAAGLVLVIVGRKK